MGTEMESTPSMKEDKTRKYSVLTPSRLITTFQCIKMGIIGDNKSAFNGIVRGTPG